MNILTHHRKWMPQTLLFCLALGVAGGAWWATNHVKRSGAAPVRAAVPVDVLDAIPRPTGTSATDLAILKWTAKARQDRGDARALINLGDALMQHVRDTADTSYYGHAERLYQKALALQPRNGEAILGLAWVSSGRHQFDQSVEWAKQAIAIDPRNHAAFGLIGDAAVEQGDYSAAYKNYQKMLDLRPDISSYSRGAHLLHITGQFMRAGWLMRKAIDSGAAYGENTAWCRAQLALIYFSDGNIAAAEQVLADALTKTPRNRHVLAAMGKVKAARKQFPTAIAFYKKAIAVAPEHDTLIALGDLYALTGNKAEAEKQFAQVEALHRRSHDASDTSHDFPMAQFYADHDRNLVEALRLAEARKLTKNPFEQDILAWCYHKNKQPQQAKAAIRRALRQKTSDARILFHAGMIYAAAGEPVDAQKYFYRAISLNPNFSPTLAPVATAMLKKLSHQTAARGARLSRPASLRRAPHRAWRDDVFVAPSLSSVGRSRGVSVAFGATRASAYSAAQHRRFASG